MKMLGVFIFLFLSGCQSDTGIVQDCKTVCSVKSSDSEVSASTIIPGDIRCLDLRIAAYKEGQKKGYCYNGPLLKGRDKEAIDPDPMLCKALVAQTKKECDNLPYDPSMIDQQISGTTTYKDGKLFMQNGELVDKCDCTKEGPAAPKPEATK